MECVLINHLPVNVLYISAVDIRLVAGPRTQMLISRVFRPDTVCLTPCPGVFLVKTQQHKQAAVTSDRFSSPLTQWSRLQNKKPIVVARRLLEDSLSVINEGVVLLLLCCCCAVVVVVVV